MHADCCYAQCWISTPLYPWVLNTSSGTLRSLRADLSVRLHLHSSRRLRANVNTRLANLKWPPLIKRPLSKEPLAPVEVDVDTERGVQAYSHCLLSFLERAQKGWCESESGDTNTDRMTKRNLWILKSVCDWQKRGYWENDKEKWLQCCLLCSPWQSGGGMLDGWGRIAAMVLQVHCVCIWWTITCFCSDSGPPLIQQEVGSWRANEHEGHLSLFPLNMWNNRFYRHAKMTTIGRHCSTMARALV